MCALNESKYFLVHFLLYYLNFPRSRLSVPRLKFRLKGVTLYYRKYSSRSLFHVTSMTVYLSRIVGSYLNETHSSGRRCKD